MTLSGPRAGPLYGYASLGRAGLGNMLFPWARCEIFCHQYRLAMLAPHWTKPKIGPLLRGERDKRYYMGLFDNSSYIRGLRRLILLATAARRPEPAVDSFQPPIAGASRKSQLLVFQGIDGLFAPLLPHRELVARRLWEILSRQSRQLLLQQDFSVNDSGAPIPHITVHVRRGDMKVLEPGQPQPPDVHTCTPHINWFATSLGEIRRLLGEPSAPAIVFSDASDAELRPLLDLPNVRRATPGPSIVDIFQLARGRILITTGNSTFSSWAALIGNMPTIRYPGTIQTMNWKRDSNVIESDVHGHLPDADAQGILQAAWSAAAARPSNVL